MSVNLTNPSGYHVNTRRNDISILGYRRDRSIYTVQSWKRGKHCEALRISFRRCARRDDGLVGRLFRSTQNDVYGGGYVPHFHIALTVQPAHEWLLKPSTSIMKAYKIKSLIQDFLQWLTDFRLLLNITFTIYYELRQGSWFYIPSSSPTTYARRLEHIETSKWKLEID